MESPLLDTVEAGQRMVELQGAHLQARQASGDNATQDDNSFQEYEQ